MNQNKINSGWILCPSKSFPGKFYYFNVITGETAWSLNEIEKNSFKKDHIVHRIFDRSHCYPEPNSPPDDFISPSQTFHAYKRPDLTRIVVNNYSVPKFGQANFPKYVEPYMPMSNIVWTPLQVPSLCLAPSMHMEPKRYVDRQPQTMQPQQDLLVQHVQASKIPLSERFTKYFNNSEVDIRLNQHVNSMPVRKTSVHVNEFPQFDKQNVNLKQKSLIKESVFKPVTTGQQPTEIKKIPSDTFDTTEGLRDFSKLRLKPTVDTNKLKCNKEKIWNVLKQTNNADNSTENENSSNLKNGDLRHLLLAKRKHSVNLNEGKKPEGKKIKLTRDTNANMKKSQKKVTFNLQGDADSLFSDTPLENDNEQGEYEVPQHESPKELWYVMVDSETLLDYYDLIEEYVKSGENCMLWLTRGVRNAIESMCVGDCRGQQRVIVARQIARRFVLPSPHFVFFGELEKYDYGTTSETDLIECCLQAIDSGYKVVLITNDTKLNVEAKSYNIDCKTTAEIKDGCKKKPEITFNLKKIKINVPNENKKDNLFLKNASEFTPFMVSNKNEIAVTSHKQRLSDSIKANEVIKVDATTSPIVENVFGDTRNDEKSAHNNEKNHKEDVQHESNISKTNDKLETDENKGKCAKPIFIIKGKKILYDKGARVVKIESQRLQKIKENSFNKLEEPTHNAPNNQLNDVSSKKRNVTKELEDFSNRNRIMEQKIKTRFSEWMCLFKQIIEDALWQLLLRHEKVNVSPSKVLKEIINRVKDLHRSNVNIQSTASKLTSLLVDDVSSDGDSKSVMSSMDFIKLIGYGLVFIKLLKAAKFYPELKDAEESLCNMLKVLTNQSPDSDLSAFGVPVTSRPNEDLMRDMRRNFVKKPSEIIDYLKAHYKDWKDYDDSVEEASLNENQTNQQIVEGTIKSSDVKIFRTLGYNSNLLNFGHDKNIKILKSANNIALNSYKNDDKSSTKIVDVLKMNSEPIAIVHNDTINITNTNMKKRKENDIKGNKQIKIKSIDSLKCSNGQVTSSVDNQKKELSSKCNVYDSYIGKTQEVKDRFNGNDLDDNAQDVKSAKEMEYSLFSPNSIDDLNIPRHGNTFNKTVDPNTNIVRNVPIIKEYENKIKTKSVLDLDILDYSPDEEEFKESSINDSEIDNIKDNIKHNSSDMSIDTVSFVYKIKQPPKAVHDSKNDENEEVKSRFFIDRNGNRKLDNFGEFEKNVLTVSHKPDDSNLRDDNTNDSGFENDSSYAYALMKTFLTELGETFKAIHLFINRSIVEIRYDEFEKARKREFQDKVNKTHRIITEIIFKLRGIITRESINGSIKLRDLLQKAGIETDDDKKILRYRQIVQKTLEQVKVLQGALNMLLDVSNGDFEGDLIVSGNADTSFLNIFE